MYVGFWFKPCLSRYASIYCAYTIFYTNDILKTCLTKYGWLLHLSSPLHKRREYNALIQTLPCLSCSSSIYCAYTILYTNDILKTCLVKYGWLLHLSSLLHKHREYNALIKTLPCLSCHSSVYCVLTKYGWLLRGVFKRVRQRIARFDRLEWTVLTPCAFFAII